MATVTNPCGISVTDTLNTIKGVFENAKANNAQAVKRDIITALVTDLGYSVKEANDISNLYYKEYKNNLSKNPPTELTNLEKALKKNAEAFLNFEADSPLLSDEEVAEIRSKYETANNFRKAGAVSKASEIEGEIANILLSKMPNTAKAKVFESFLYTKPLISIRFFTSSFISNWIENVNRVVSTAFTTKGGIDLRPLANILGTKYGFLKALGVLKGGTTAMDTVTTETNNNIQNTTPERLRLGGLSSAFAAIAQFAKKGIDLPDTLGIISATDMHYRTLITNKKYDELRKEGHTRSAAKELSIEFADEQMELMNESDAMMVADKVFEDNGQPVDNKFRKSTEYKIAVEEIKRSNRDEQTTQRAFLKSAEDYFKARMTQSSEFGAAYHGIFGMFARVMNSVKQGLVNSAETSTSKGDVKTARAKQALGLGVFGFLNGASAFAEKSLEAVPIYGILKIGALGISGQKLSDELRTEVGQKQRDIVVRMAVGLAMYGIVRGIKEIAEDNCGNKGLKVPESNIFGKYRTTICGKQIMPFVIPAQFEALFGFYNWLFDTSVEEKGDNLFADSIGAVVGLLSNARLGADQPSSKMVDNLFKGLKESQRGNNVAKDEYYSKAMNYGVGIAVNYANSFLPAPTRPFQEIGSYFDSEQKQLRPVFDIKDPDNFVKTLGNTAKYNIANVFGVMNYYNAFADTDKPYLDWQGRTAINLRKGYFAGEGIQYNKYDDLFAQANAPLPYLSPYKEIKTGVSETRMVETPLSTKGREVTEQPKRYLTQDEFYEVQKQSAQFSKEFMDTYYADFMNLPKEDRDREVRGYSDRLSRYVFKGLEEGYEPKDIKDYLWQEGKMISNKKLKSTESEIE